MPLPHYSEREVRGEADQAEVPWEGENIELIPLLSWCQGLLKKDINGTGYRDNM